LLGSEAALPNAILLSKCQSVAGPPANEFLARRDSDNRVRIYPQVESPIAIVNAFAIATSCPRVAGLAFGAEDFSADMGITRTEGEIELLYARSALVTACRAAGRDAIDSPCLEWKNLEHYGPPLGCAQYGFSGKRAIHPAQVPVINEIFPRAPWRWITRRILAAFWPAHQVS
jgi:citrate lyase beta subunit